MVGGGRGRDWGVVLLLRLVKLMLASAMGRTMAVLELQRIWRRRPRSNRG